MQVQQAEGGHIEQPRHSGEEALSGADTSAAQTGEVHEAPEQQGEVAATEGAQQPGTASTTREEDEEIQEVTLLDVEREAPPAEVAIPAMEFTLPTIEEMLEAGVHWGHQRKKWNPHMEPYIWGLHNRIHIIDLTKTREELRRAQQFAFQLVYTGRLLLYVGTKRHVKEIVRAYAERAEMPYVTERWLGGMLTNFLTIRHTMRKLEDIESMIRDGTFETLTKKERLSLLRQKEKMERLLGGILKMTRLPGAIYVVDAVEEETAIREAHRLGIPIIAIVDSNADPRWADFPIPGNDDSARSVELITKYLTEAIVRARELRRQLRAEVRERRPRREASAGRRLFRRERRGDRDRRSRTLRRRR